MTSHIDMIGALRKLNETIRKEHGPGFRVWFEVTEDAYIDEGLTFNFTVLHLSWERPFLQGFLIVPESLNSEKEFAVIFEMRVEQATREILKAIEKELENGS